MQPWMCVTPCSTAATVLATAHSAVVVRMNAENAVEAFAHLGHDLDNAVGKIAAIRVAEAQNVGTGGAGRFESPQGEGLVTDVAVEEVLGVEDHFLAVVLQKAHGLGDELDVLLFA